MAEITYHDFRPEENKEISFQRMGEIQKMAEDIFAMETFFETVEIDEAVYKTISKAYPVFNGSMQNDFIRSTEEDWLGRPEYFKRIFDTFVLSDFNEMRLFQKYKDSLD